MRLEKWKKQTYASKNALIASLVLIGLIASYNWAVSPHLDYLLASERYESVTANLVERYQAIRDDVIGKRRKLNELQKEIQQTHVRLFDKAEAREFFNDIQLMAKNANCTVGSLDFLPAASASETGRAQVDKYITLQCAKLGVVGSYQNLITLLNRLQDRSEQVEINSLTIKPIRGKSDQLKCDVTVTVYVIEDKERDSHD